jgi:hypothetical protein
MSVDIDEYRAALDGRGVVVRRLVWLWIAFATLPGRALIAVGLLTRTWLVVLMGADLLEMAMRALLLMLGHPSKACVRRHGRIARLSERLQALTSEVDEAIARGDLVAARGAVNRGEPLSSELEQLIAEHQQETRS